MYKKICAARFRSKVASKYSSGYVCVCIAGFIKRCNFGTVYAVSGSKGVHYVHCFFSPFFGILPLRVSFPFPLHIWYTRSCFWSVPNYEYLRLCEATSWVLQLVHTYVRRIFFFILPAIYVHVIELPQKQTIGSDWK